MLKQVVTTVVMGALVVAINGSPSIAADSPARTPVTALAQNNGYGKASTALGGNTSEDLRMPGAKGTVATKTVPKPKTTTTAPVRVISDDECRNPNTNLSGWGELKQCTVATPRVLQTNNAPKPPAAKQVAQDFYAVADLPQPMPKISAKNGGICGVEHSLNLNVPVEKVYQYNDTDFGLVTLHVYGIVTVDWGDGSKGTYTNSGADWPKSDIKHSWTTAGTYTIRSTIDWVGRVTVANNGAPYTLNVSGVQTFNTIPAFRVQQAQAVITS